MRKQYSTQVTRLPRVNPASSSAAFHAACAFLAMNQGASDSFLMLL